MSSDPKTYDGPYPTPETLGMDRPYAEARKEAEKELLESMAGPKNALVPPEGSRDLKNPDNEFENPAPMVGARPTSQAGPGPNQVGNSSGRGPVDPQGQQGGTYGGQRAVPPSSKK